MKKANLIYWMATGILCAVMVFSAINFMFFDYFPFPEGAFNHIGLPNYFRIELTIAKILGVFALLMPNVHSKIKEFAYFGFAITLISASIAHFSVGDSLMFIIDPLIFLGVLIVSYVYFYRV